MTAAWDTDPTESFYVTSPHIIGSSNSPASPRTPLRSPPLAALHCRLLGSCMKQASKMFRSHGRPLRVPSLLQSGGSRAGLRGRWRETAAGTSRESSGARRYNRRERIRAFQKDNNTMCSMPHVQDRVMHHRMMWNGMWYMVFTKSFRK